RAAGHPPSRRPRRGRRASSSGRRPGPPHAGWVDRVSSQAERSRPAVGRALFGRGEAMKKKLKWVVGIVALLVIVGVVVVILSLNSIVRVAVEKGSTKSLQIPTSLGGARLALLSGDVSLKDYEVASPEGFDAPHMLTLGSLSVDTSYGKVFGEPVAIDAIRIDKPKLVLEFKGTKSNIKAVADKLASGTGGDQPQPTPTDDKTAKPMKLIIDQLNVDGASVVLKTDLLGGKEYTIDVPAISMAGIGNADGNRNGEEVGKVVSQVISRLTLEAQKSGKIPPELAAILNSDLDELVGKLGAQFQGQVAQFQEQAKAIQAQAQQQLDAAKQQVGQQIDKTKAEAEQKAKQLQDEAKNKLGNLLGGAKKDEEKK
ncbi:AsmA family protein, partial [bacterium]